MKFHLTIISLFMATCLTGCFSSHPEDIRAFKRPQNIDVSMSSYILQPADEIHLSCSAAIEIHDDRQKIRPDGKISYEMLGEIQAAGKTPEELSEIIKQKVLQKYKLEDEQPVDIIITTYQSKYFYVLGQVNLPGPRLCTGRDSAIKAINSAQPNGLAWKERIQIIRPSNDENIKPAIFELNYDRVRAHGEESNDVLLQEGDIIYVPPTFLGLLSLKIEEFLNPITRAFSGAFTVRRGMSDRYRDY